MACPLWSWSLLVCASPLPKLKGVALQAQVGSTVYTQSVTRAVDPKNPLGDAPPSTTAFPQVSLSLHYGQLTRGPLSGTRVLIKAYVANQDENPNVSTVDVASRLESAYSSASLWSTPLSISEAMANNEVAAHERLQGDSITHIPFLSKCLGQEETRWGTAASNSEEPASILNVFVWTGERVRMAMPEKPPPTLASYLSLRKRGATVGAFADRSVPFTATVARSKFLRSALSDALRGLQAMHDANLLHTSITPEAIGITQEDDRAGVKGRLENFMFARDARSCELVHRVDASGEVLARFAEQPDPLDAELKRRARRAGATNSIDLARFGRADDLRAFGVTCLVCIVGACAPSTCNLESSELYRLIDGPFALDLFESPTDGSVDVAALREYLESEDRLQIFSNDKNGGVGGVDILKGCRGWDLLELLLGPWDQRPTCAEALAHPFWTLPCKL